MNPQHAAQGHQPNSNEILKAEKKLVESKQEKCIEIIKQNGEIHDILEGIKGDPDIDQITGGQGVDLSGIIKLLFSDTHFMNLLGALLTKKPSSKTVEDFMAKQTQDKIDQLKTDAQIQKSF